jgi:hypothetical protein
VEPATIPIHALRRSLRLRLMGMLHGFVRLPKAFGEPIRKKNADSTILELRPPRVA